MDCGGLATQQQRLLLQQQQLLLLQQQKQQQQQQRLEEQATTNIKSAVVVVGGASGGSELLVDSCQVGSGSGSGSGSLGGAAGVTAVKLRRQSDRCLTTPEAKSHTYRISMANLEDTQESELDLILGELSLLEAQISYGEASFLPQQFAVQAQLPPPGAAAPASSSSSSSTPIQSSNSVAANAIICSSSSSSASAASSRSHSRTNSSISVDVNSSCSSTSSGISENGHHPGQPLLGNVGQLQGMTMGITMGVMNPREPRTESPDNDSAFSDTVSLLSSESSASSNTSTQQQQQQQQQKLQQAQLQLQRHHQSHHSKQQPASADSISKAAKIQLALHKLESASIRRLFVKAFTADGASKSLLVDERMSCGHVTRLLADKNHVQMQPNWALIENLGDLQMERLFEDHELLVDNLMTWNSDAGNRVLFQQRQDKVALFARPELYLPGTQMAPGCLHDEHTRHMLLEEFFETSAAQLQVDGPLYMKADSKKGWKRYHFVLRSSGLYYFPKEKTKNTRDLACLTLFAGHNVYTGLGWRKKWKSPTDYTFGFKAAMDSSLGKSCRSLKMLCAEDLETMERWLTAIRICKYGKQLWENQKTLIEDLSSGDGSCFAASMRSESISSISSAVPSQCGSVSSAISSMSNMSNMSNISNISNSSSGRISRASSSSSSGCLSDDNNGFDSEFTTGTIKRKPSMKPNLPLTTMTRQLKEVGEITICESGAGAGEATSPERGGTLTRRHSRRKSQESNGSGTLKRRPAAVSVAVAAVAKRDVVEVMTSGGSSSSSNSTPTPTPSICAKPLLELELAKPVDNNELMCSSTLSLDSLPLPPPPLIASVQDEADIYGSQLSLASLPPPPPPEEELAIMATAEPPLISSIMALPNSNGTLPPAVPAKPFKPAVKNALKAAPPYKAPPDYVGPPAAAQLQPIQAVAAPVQKKVSFADSPVLLRRKISSPEPVSYASYAQPPPQPIYAAGPLLPPRADRLSSSSVASNSNSISLSSEVSSPKRLQESASNPPRDFLKDLQRVMRKKWQVAQKCKLEPATTPHEVLGFRDFNNEDLLAAHQLNSGAHSSHYYRETANVSHWVQEHYGAGAAPPPPPTLNEYALYENIHSNGNNTAATAVPPPNTATPTAALAQPMAMPLEPLRKKRPPPPPPKRSDSTHLTHRV